MGKEGYKSVSYYRNQVEGCKTDREKLSLISGLLANSTQPSAPGSREIMRRQGKISREAYAYLRAEKARIASNVEDGKNGLVQQVSLVIAIAGIIGGIFFLSPSLTGNAIANSTNSTFNLIGVSLIAIGLASGLFYINNRKNQFYYLKI